MSGSPIQDALEQAMNARIRVYAVIPILLALMFFVATYIQRDNTNASYLTLSFGLILVLLITSSFVMRFSHLNWRLKLIAYIGPLVPGALLAYWALGTYAGAFGGIYLALLVASLAFDRRQLWGLLIIAVATTSLIGYLHYQDFIPGTLPRHLELVWNNTTQTLFVGFFYLLGLVMGVVLLLPPAETLDLIANEQKKLSQEVALRQDSVNSSKSALFSGLGGFTIELDDQDRLCNLSTEAQNQLNEHSAPLKHYGDTKLATLKILPGLIDAARTTGTSYTARIEPGTLSKQSSVLSLTPYQANDGTQHLILTNTSAGKQQADPTPLFAQQLGEYLNSAKQVAAELTVIGYQLVSPKQQLEEFSALNIALKHLLDNSGAGSYRFLGDGSVEGYIAAVHYSRAGQEAFKTMLKNLHHDHNQSGSQFTVALLHGQLNPERIHAITAQALKLKSYLESLEQTEFLEIAANDELNWSQEDRRRLKSGVSNGDLSLKLIESIKGNDSLTTLREIKLLWNTAEQPEQTSEQVINALEYHGLSRYLGKLQSTQLIPTITDGQAEHPNDDLGLLIPGGILSDEAALEALSEALINSNIDPQRLWLRIYEATASQLSEQHWLKLKHLNSLGFKFMLGEVGAGDTDIKLLTHPLFGMAHFSRSMAVAATQSRRASLIFEESLNIARSFKLLTMAKAPNEASTINYLKACGVHYIDIA